MDLICTVHIGLHKTGSSTLQNMLAAEEPRLQGHGIYLPKAGRHGNAIAHHLLAWELNRRPGFKDSRHFDALAGEIENRHFPARILLSSENFSTHMHNPRIMGRLRKKIERLGYRLRIIAYVRPQETAVHSLYTQRLKMLKINDTFDAFWPKAIRGERFDYDERFAFLLSTEEVDLRIFPFGRATVEKSICRQFLSAIDIPAEALGDFSEPPPANVSPDPKTIAAALAIGLELERRHVSLNQVNLESASQIMRIMGRELEGSEGRFNALTPELAASIREHFRRSNARFANRVFGRSWDDVFAADIADTAAPNVFDPARAPLEERRAFDKVVETMVEAIMDLLGSSQSEPPVEPEPE
jgi:hypothetical protein